MVLVLFAIEDRLPEVHFRHYAAIRPNVHPKGIIGSPIEHLWRPIVAGHHLVRIRTQRLVYSTCMAEVCKLYVLIRVKKDVLGLQIPVEKSVGVQAFYP